MSDEYMPLRTGKDEAGDDEAFGIPPNEEVPKRSNSSLSFWLTVVFSVFSIASALALHANVTANAALNFADPKNLATLKKLMPYPNLNQTNRIKATKSMPKLWFPGQMIRGNAAQPDEVFSNSQHVTLSPTDSMFYHWALTGKKSHCYIWAVVPSAKTLEEGGKGYTAEGDVTEIEVWNVTTTHGKLTPLSWNTRPERLNLLGSVNFTHRANPSATGDHEGWDAKELLPPTPRLPCFGETRITLEIACKSCKLEFDQIFSDPALGFDLQELA